MTKQQRVSFAAALLVVPMLTVLAIPAHAQGNLQISGTAEFDADDFCGDPPAGFESYVIFTLKLDGDFEGCLWTLAESGKVTNGNGYQERGQEVIEGCLNDSEVCGRFETTYQFTSKWEGEPFASEQINGRCQHPIQWGSGTDGLENVSGRLDFKDDVEEGDFDWVGHITL